MKAIKITIPIILFLIIFTSCGKQQYKIRKPEKKFLSILTYNVLGWNNEIEKRNSEIIKLLYNHNADIISLQEVKPSLLKKMMNLEWVKEEYHTYHFPSNKKPFGSLVTLSKYPIERIAYFKIPGYKKRSILISYINFYGKIIPFVNIHLESPLRSHKMRKNQLKYIFNIISDYDSGVVCGDFNFGDKEKLETSAIDKSFKDLWRKIYPYKKGYTWNTRENKLALRNAFKGEKSRRIDRIIYKLNKWKPYKISYIGRDKVKISNKINYPSDHFGLLGIFKKR